MQTEWMRIAQFPNYSVSDSGFVRNDETGKELARLVNQHGIVHVGLMLNGKQRKKSLPLLVAEAFVPRSSFEFDSVINLDGDRYNNEAYNLMWRPLWFVRGYFQELRRGRPIITRPVQLIETEEVFDNSLAAATTLGLLESEIVESVMTRNWVFPIFKHFRLLR